MHRSADGHGPASRPGAKKNGETARQWRRALELLYAMGLVKLERTTITCSAAISACKNGGGWQRPLEILRARRAIVDRDTFTYSAAISAVEDSGA